MAVQKLYTVCFIPSWRGKSEEPFLGFTVARSDEEVMSIIRRHVPPNKTFWARSSTAGPVPPTEASMAARYLERYGFEWLDPRGPKYHPVGLVSDLVAELMTAGQAL